MTEKDKENFAILFVVSIFVFVGALLLGLYWGLDIACDNHCAFYGHSYGETKDSHCVCYTVEEVLND